MHILFHQSRYVLRQGYFYMVMSKHGTLSQLKSDVQTKPLSQVPQRTAVHTRSVERDGEMKKQALHIKSRPSEYQNVVVAMIPSAKQEPDSHHPNIPPF